MSLYIFATEHGYIVHFAFLALSIIQFHYFIIKQPLQNAILQIFGPSVALPSFTFYPVLPGFYPITQGKTG